MEEGRGHVQGGGDEEVRRQAARGASACCVASMLRAAHSAAVDPQGRQRRERAGVHCPDRGCLSVSDEHERCVNQYCCTTRIDPVYCCCILPADAVFGRCCWTASLMLLMRCAVSSPEIVNVLANDRWFLPSQGSTEEITCRPLSVRKFASIDDIAMAENRPLQDAVMEIQLRRILVPPLLHLAGDANAWSMCTECSLVTQRPTRIKAQPARRGSPQACPSPSTTTMSICWPPSPAALMCPAARANAHHMAGGGRAPREIAV